MNSVWIGFDPRPAEAMAFAVTRASVARYLNRSIPVRGLVLADLKAQGLYWRPTELRPSGEKPVLWDVISDATMATEFAISRFLVPHLVRMTSRGGVRAVGSDKVLTPRNAKLGWHAFMDGDMLARADLKRACDGLDPAKAVYVVKHDHRPTEATKMDGQVQTRYARKNWSSFMIFNLDHPANDALTPEMVNTLPGRDLHRFCWLDDVEIGALDPSWNWLAGHSDPAIEPKVVHFTAGVPAMMGYENAPYADEWRSALDRWAA